MDFYMFDTPVGAMALGAEAGQLVRLYLPNTPTPRLMSRETPLLKLGQEQLLDYLAGRRKAFDLPLAPEGTPFMQRIWAVLAQIPWGQVRTYGDIAQDMGCPGGARAVGMACSRNPLPILIPCHRVVGAGGVLTGYAGGLELKRKLLAVEEIEKI